MAQLCVRLALAWVEGHLGLGDLNAFLRPSSEGLPSPSRREWSGHHCHPASLRASPALAMVGRRVSRAFPALPGWLPGHCSQDTSHWGPRREDTPRSSARGLLALALDRRMSARCTEGLPRPAGESAGGRGKLRDAWKPPLPPLPAPSLQH